MGLKFLEFAGFARKNMKVCPTAHPEIKALAEETGEWANLLIKEIGWGLCSHRTGERSSRTRRLRRYTDRPPLYRPRRVDPCTQTPVVRNIIDQYGLEPVTPHSITERETLFSQFEEIRGQGYTTDDEERLQNMRCVAASIVYP